jgi:hypothetical protein
VSVETIRQLAGHVSDRMLGRYAHIRVQARREAIATLELTAKNTEISGYEGEGTKLGTIGGHYGWEAEWSGH